MHIHKIEKGIERNFNWLDEGQYFILPGDYPDDVFIRLDVRVSEFNALRISNGQSYSFSSDRKIIPVTIEEVTYALGVKE